MTEFKAIMYLVKALPTQFVKIPTTPAADRIAVVLSLNLLKSVIYELLRS